MQTKPHSQAGTPANQSPQSHLRPATAHEQRVLIDEVATLRGLMIQLSLQLMCYHAAPTDLQRNAARDAFCGLADRFGKNMKLVFGNEVIFDQPQDMVSLIRRAGKKHPSRISDMHDVQVAVDKMRHRVRDAKPLSFDDAQRFFDTNFVKLRDHMTEVIWDLWAELDENAVTAIASSNVLTGTLETTMRDIQKISTSVRLTALNASVEAARAGDSGRGFAVIASEIKALAEKIHQSTSSAERTIAAINTELKH